MDPRQAHILSYIKEHIDNYSFSSIKKQLLNHGYSEEEVDEAKLIYDNGGIRDSFFSEFEKKKQKKPRFPYHILALVLSIIPFIGIIYSYYASLKINEHNLNGRETAFLSMLTNLIITLLFLLYVTKKFL